jgi:hypothetical protein
MTQHLPTPVADYIAASNSFDGDRLAATFAESAMVNDARREFWGVDAIKQWADKEIIGDKVTMEVTDVKSHFGLTVVNALMDGEFDKTNLPERLVLTHYFTVQDDRIVTLIIIRNDVTDA